MDRNVVLHLAVFVGLLLALNLLFGLHISILGSLALTLVLNVALRAFSPRTRRSDPSPR